MSAHNYSFVANTFNLRNHVDRLDTRVTPDTNLEYPVHVPMGFLARAIFVLIRASVCLFYTA